MVQNRVGKTFDLKFVGEGILTQRAMTSPEPPAIFDDFWRHAYAAIAD